MSYRFADSLRAGRQRRGCIIPQAVTHSLVLLKMGGIDARSMLSWLELLINRFLLHLVGVCIIYSAVFLDVRPGGTYSNHWALNGW